MQVPRLDGVLAVVVDGDARDELLLRPRDHLAQHLDRLVAFLGEPAVALVGVLERCERGHRLRAVQEPRRRDPPPARDLLHAFGIERDAVVVEGERAGIVGLVDDDRPQRLGDGAIHGLALPQPVTDVVVEELRAQL